MQGLAHANKGIRQLEGCQRTWCEGGRRFRELLQFGCLPRDGFCSTYNEELVQDLLRRARERRGGAVAGWSWVFVRSSSLICALLQAGDGAFDACSGLRQLIF